MERENEFGFVRFEPIWLDPARHFSPKSDGYDIEGQTRVIAAVRAQHSKSHTAILESTRTAP